MRTRLLTNTALTGVRPDGGTYSLDLHHDEQDCAFTPDTHGLVLATGYRYAVPEFLEPVRDRIAWDDHGRFDVARDYSIDTRGGEVFVQNAELHTHGFVAPDLGMAAYRNSSIIRELLGREHYRIEKSIAAAALFTGESRPPVMLSPEQLGVLEADVLVVGLYGENAAAAFSADPVFLNLRVAQEGRAVLLPELSEANGAMTFGSVLSLPAALAEIGPRLAAAIDGDPATEVAPAA